VCTAWDPFHRVDNAVWRAIRQVGPVLNIFDAAKQTSYLFGMSEGTHILKAVAAESGEILRTVKAPGGTRKVVYLAGVPGSLLDNYALYYKGLHARVAWKQLGHSKQSLSRLLAIGRDMARPDFVLTMLFTHDILRLTIRPFAKRVQAHLEPCGIMAAQDVLMGQLGAARDAIQRLRRIAAVAALCRQHFVSGDLVRFLRAFAAGSLGKLFPTFFDNVAGIYGSTKVFRGVEMAVVDGHNSSQEMFLGSLCQCSGIASVLETDWGHILAGRRPRMVGDTRRAVVVVRGRDVNVPAWVAAGSAAVRPQDGHSSLMDVEPRCLFRPTGLAPPPGRAFRCMFRKSCQVSRQAFLLDRCGQEAMRDIEIFLDRLSAELTSILGSVGVNDSLSHLVSAAARCWDWPRLVFDRPTVPDVRAFVALAGALRPCLEHTLFPAGIAEFVAVPHHWPDDNAPAVQYVTLCSLVRRAHAAAKSGDPTVPQTVRDCAAQWVQSTFLEVREMRAARVVQLTVGRAWSKTWGDELAARAIDCTSQFLGGGGQRLHR
jgi:hypothetical protein